MAVFDGIQGFDWDLHNVGHVDRHGVDPTEVEEAVERPHAIIPAREAGGEKRWKLFGYICGRTVFGRGVHDSG
jgi:hypothetical protein